VERGDHHLKGPHLLTTVIAGVFLVIGFSVILFPLIYIPFLLTSAALFASQSRSIACLLDRTEASGWAVWSAISKKIGLSPRSVGMLTLVFSLGCLGLMSRVCHAAFAH
jgi:hypothetical protein